MTKPSSRMSCTSIRNGDADDVLLVLLTAGLALAIATKLVAFLAGGAHQLTPACARNPLVAASLARGVDSAYET